jgi:hypothetical protein
MKQLDSKVSSPWDIKKGESSSPSLDTSWTKIQEEQKKENEQKEKEEVKKTHYSFYLNFPPFGWHIKTGCRLDQRPPAEILYPVMESTQWAKNPLDANFSRPTIMAFELYAGGANEIYYHFSGFRK